MHGLYLLWWVQERQMSPAVVAAVLAAGDLVLMLLEVPTGWFADRYGHRRSLILGSAAQTLGMLMCWLGRGIPGLVAASVLVAVGDGFRSGADQALLYRTCAALGRGAEFQGIQARTHAVRQAAMVGQILAGGAIVATWGFVAGWIAEAMLSFVGLAIACAMVEPPAEGHLETVHSTLEAACIPAIRLDRLIALMLPAAILGGTASVASFLAQTTGHGEPVGMTMLVAVVTLAEAAGSALAIRLTAVGVRTHRALAGAGLVCFVLGAAIRPAFVPVVIALAFLVGVVHPLRASAIQHTVPDHLRARAASLASVCDMAVNLIALPLAGMWRGRRG